MRGVNASSSHRPTATQASSRSHLYSQSISHLVDTAPASELFHLDSAATSSGWSSIDERDEVSAGQAAAWNVSSMQQQSFAANAADDDDREDRDLKVALL